MSVGNERQTHTALRSGYFGMQKADSEVVEKIEEALPHIQPAPSDGGTLAWLQSTSCIFSDS